MLLTSSSLYSVFVKSNTKSWSNTSSNDLISPFLKPLEYKTFKPSFTVILFSVYKATLFGASNIISETFL